MDFLINFLMITLSLLKWIVLANIVMSLIRVSKTNILYLFTNNLLEPIYLQVRKLPHKVWMFDFSPLFILIWADLISYFLMNYIA